MRLTKPIHCLLLTLSLLVAGCNTGGTDSNGVESSVVNGVSTQSADNDLSSLSDDAVDAEQPESDTPVEPTSESDLLVDDAALSPSTESVNEAVPVHTFELSLDQARAALDEGNRDGTTIVIEVSPDGEESIELIVEPENPVDGQGVEISLTQQRLDHENRRTDVTFMMPVGMQPRREHQRTFFVRATSGEQTRTQTITLGVEPLNAPDVYLLIGQSNMVGSSEEGAKQLTSGGADEQDSRIWQLNVTYNDADLFARPADYVRDDRIAVEPRFVQAQDPLHEPLRADRDEKGGTKVGSGMSFARAASRGTTQQIYLVPAAWGGSGFCDQLSYHLAWNAYTSDNRALGGSGLLDRAIARLNLTLQDTGGVFRGILWHQGEADSGSSACADSYAQNITRMVERIRIEASEDARGESARGPQAPIPFVLGTMSKGEDSRGDFSRWSETKEQVDGVHRQITELVPYANWVNNDDLVPPAYPCGSGSCVHFGSLAIREMGYRYYQALGRIWDGQPTQ